jgi:REP element-mobilizing transposase RayT
MGQSLVKNYIHIVFSTKYREPLIHPPLESELHSYLAGICNNLECHPVIVGGYTDHVHILCMLSKKIALMKLVEKMKSHSSKWIKTKDESLENFYWQDGYGAFSVNQEGLGKVIAYIKKQHKHHSGKNFQEEYMGLLEEHGAAFDERYVWG